MDKFVVRSPRNLQNDEIKISEIKTLRQSTLQSLAGVVVLEDFERAKKVLESDEESTERKIDVLKSLESKKPSKEVLVKVGIGKTIRKLSKDPCTAQEASPNQAKLKKLSYQIYKSWKTELERKVELQRETIIVDSDKETKRLRSAAVRLINTSIKSSRKQIESEQRKLSEEIEQEIFCQSKKLVGHIYRKLNRKIIFGLKNPELCSQLIVGDLSVPELVKRFQSQK